jgi:hypothetical protein
MNGQCGRKLLLPDIKNNMEKVRRGRGKMGRITRIQRLQNPELTESGGQK